MGYGGGGGGGGRGYGRGGGGRGRGRGRGRGPRWIGAMPPASHYEPRGVPPGSGGLVTLTLEEFEAIRLVDLIGMDQESAAMEMGVSRKSLWNDLKSARRKVAEALVNGWAIRIEGGNYILRQERMP